METGFVAYEIASSGNYGATALMVVEGPKGETARIVAALAEQGWEHTGVTDELVKYREATYWDVAQGEKDSFLVAYAMLMK